MIYGSVCSGIEAATVAWHPLGWKPAFFAEIEKHPCSVLKHHYPDVPNLGDMTKFKEWPDYAIDLLIGGTPCQSFSVAGLRKGLADPRGNLALTFLAVADRYRPEWIVWENVPGVLSSEGGRDFGSFLGGLAELGYGFAYRVLDAQFIRVESHPFAVPQRRRRVIVVAHLGDWRRAAAVLFERESLSGHPPPRREAGKGIAPTISARPTGGGGLGIDFDLDGGLIAPDVSPAMKARDSKGPSSDGDGDGLPLIAGTMKSMDKSGRWSNSADHAAAGYMVPVAHTLKADGFDASEDGTGRGTPIVPIAFDAKGSQVQTDETGAALPLRSMGHDKSHANDGSHMAIAIQGAATRENPKSGPDGIGVRTDGAAYTVEARAEVQMVSHQMAVRRLTPVECCRLQGFPDDYLDCLKSDGPKYKALGNSMATNVIRWLGDRIEMVRKI
jgi:DNA (cytosine-5)-methyltransferase 1